VLGFPPRAEGERRRMEWSPKRGEKTENKFCCSRFFDFGARVAGFFSVHDTKTRKNVPNEHKMYHMVLKISQMSIKYSKRP
jgi:hypothetical protein